jgi:starch phosphorylase
VAAIHSELLRKTTVKDLAGIFPERFNNKTNGVTPRRWLLLANPALSQAITGVIGDSWITDLSQLSRLKPLSADLNFRDAFRKAKRDAKWQFADWLRWSSRQTVDPDTIFDCHVRHSRIQAAIAHGAAGSGALQPATENPELKMLPERSYLPARPPSISSLSSSSSSSTISPLPLTATRLYGAVLRSCSCPTTAFHSRSG